MERLGSAAGAQNKWGEFACARRILANAWFAGDVEDVTSLRRAVGAASVLEDARFVLNTMRASLRLSARQHHVPALALMPTFSLATFETRRWVSQHFPEAPANLPEEGAELVETVRNASKWVDATRGKPEVALERFRRVADHHASRFLGNARFKWAQRFENDLGVYRCGGVDVLNTHTVGLLLGDWANPMTNDQAGPAVRDAAANMSALASALVGEHLLAGASFVEKLSPITMHDVRSDNYYGGQQSGVRGYAQLLRNSLAWGGMIHASSQDERGAAFKFRFLSL